MKTKSMWVMLGLRAKVELEDILLSKEVWLALIGILIAVAKWQSWDIPSDIFITIEVLITAVILALSKNSGD